MKTSDGLTRYSSKADYLSKTPSQGKGVLKGLSKSAGESASTVNKTAAQTDKIELSDAAKEKSKDLAKIPKQIGDKAKETVSAGKKLLGDGAVSLLKKAANTPGLSNLITPSLSGEGNEVEEAQKTVEKREAKTINKPGIFFLKDFSINPFASDDFGLTGMASNIPTAEAYNWNDEDEIIDQIKRRPLTQPIILVGHGMGGDSIVNIASKLNTMENGFRKVNLLVTMDSIGFDNDIIPQNVKENLNIISDEDTFFNDGPNIARDKYRTKIANDLRQESHSDLSESPEVQFSIFEKINEVLGQAVAGRNMEKQRMGSLMAEQLRSLKN